MTVISSRERYIAKFPKSRTLFEEAQGVLPRGVSHDAWYMLPFPIFISHAKGPHQWDVDGYKYVDYFGGHGAFLLGHAHPSLIKAVSNQIKKGSQYGTADELAIEWAKLIKSLIPSAELVEFTNSGTEANMLAVRLARAFTGRSKIVRFRYHFGGWYDSVGIGVRPPWSVPHSGGIPPDVLKDTIVIPCNSSEALEDALKNDDVALLMVEAAGASSGKVGIAPSFYQTMRELTLKYGTLLHFDEVITAFRYSPGGVQAAMNVTPDLTSLGKSVNGGIPGAGAVVGRKDIMNMLAFKDDNRDRSRRVSHTGTFNASPVCAASGIETLKILSTGEPQRKANELALILRQAMQKAMDELGVIGCVYGDFSVFHIYIGDCDMQGSCDKRICLNEDKLIPSSMGNALAMNLTLNGIHVPTYGTKGFLSAVHTKEDVDKTTEAFRNALTNMIEEKLIT